uniref:SET domain-containing protein n=1 Tax=Romanomermis culicivorax TaxID=13658 RepID=A0A915KTW1_ROMCU
SIVINRNQKSKNHALNPDLLIHQIYDIFSKLSQQFNEKYEEIITEDSYATVQSVIYKHCGFCLEKRKSNVESAGLGVFVKNGRLPKHVVVAFYPGTIYRPGEAAFLQSLGNKFVLRCIDGTLIDGNDRGLSKLVFKSCTLRDRMGKNLLNDMTWLTELPANPLAVGQYVNNAASEEESNVFYEEVDFPVSFLNVNERRFLPNVLYANTRDCDRMRTVVLISNREIEKDEELKSNYLTLFQA